DGTVYEAYFVGHGENGAVARVAPAGGENDVMTGLGKPVGVVVDRDRLLARDQDAGAIVSFRLPACATKDRVATVAGADLMTTDRAGNIYVGRRDGGVYCVHADGKTDTLATGVGRVRGIAVDDAGRRVFLAVNRDGHPAIKILPLP